MSTFIGIGVLIYLNLEVLFPKLYFRKIKIIYVLVCIILAFLMVQLIHWDAMPWADSLDFRGGKSSESFRSKDSLRHRFSVMRYIGRLTPFLISIFGSTFYVITRYANQKAQEAIELRNEKLITEMKFLKSQINPHFLFNSLNNIYTLVVIKSDLAPDNLLKLSDMLRYMLYDCKADRVSLDREIKYIRDFIDLNKLKDSRGLNVAVNLDESRPGLMIAPLLFVPFIENAFKHSKIEDLENGWIKIDLKTTDERIQFSVQNSIPEKVFSKDEIGGIGLKNVRRQLELIYPEKHELIVNFGENQFDISLNIEII
jgi:sensor histidine kinase YesM